MPGTSPSYGTMSRIIGCYSAVGAAVLPLLLLATRLSADSYPAQSRFKPGAPNPITEIPRASVEWVP